MINVRRYAFHVCHDTIELKGEIVYNSKDYHVALLHPFYARNIGKGLMNMIPARYTTPIDLDRDQRKDGVIRLEERGPQDLVDIYEIYKDTSFTDFVRIALTPHEEALYFLLKESFLLIDGHERKKKHIKEEHRLGSLSNKEQSQKIQEENKRIRSEREQIKSIYTEYFQVHNIVIPPVHTKEIIRLIEEWHTSSVTQNKR
jgi:hypothetical protein